MLPVLAVVLVAFLVLTISARTAYRLRAGLNGRILIGHVLLCALAGPSVWLLYLLVGAASLKSEESWFLSCGVLFTTGTAAGALMALALMVGNLLKAEPEVTKSRDFAKPAYPSRPAVSKLIAGQLPAPAGQQLIWCRDCQRWTNAGSVHQHIC